MITRRALSDRACDEIWARISGKKYAYGFGRDSRFIDRCARIQDRLLTVQKLRRLEISGIVVDDVLEGNLIFMRKMFKGERDGSTEHAARL